MTCEQESIVTWAPLVPVLLGDDEVVHVQAADAPDLAQAVSVRSPTTVEALEAVLQPWEEGCWQPEEDLAIVKVKVLPAGGLLRQIGVGGWPYYAGPRLWVRSAPFWQGLVLLLGPYCQWVSCAHRGNIF